MKTLMAESGDSNGRYSTALNFNYIQHSEAHRAEIRMKQWTIGSTAHKVQLQGQASPRANQDGCWTSFFEMGQFHLHKMALYKFNWERKTTWAAFYRYGRGFQADRWNHRWDQSSEWHYLIPPRSCQVLKIPSTILFVVSWLTKCLCNVKKHEQLGGALLLNN